MPDLDLLLDPVVTSGGDVGDVSDDLSENVGRFFREPPGPTREALRDVVLAQAGLKAVEGVIASLEDKQQEE
jgi:hypothetical protein